MEGVSMFSSLFLSKNQKLVKKWTKEHEKIVLLTHNVIAEYSKNNHKKAKKLLKSLNNLVIDHVTDENIKFYQLQKDRKKLSLKHEEAVEEFIETFKDTKSDLMNFLTRYSRDSVHLDETFFTTLNQLAEILIERIEFEEKNLYELLNISKEEEKWERIKREI
jgi:uncharacterized protein YdiU (UPF0061 family)